MPDIDDAQFKTGGSESDVKNALDRMTSRETVDYRTEIDNPVAVTVLDVMTGYYSGKLPRSGARIGLIRDYLLLRMVAFRRKGEAAMLGITDAASGARANREEKEFRDKMLGAMGQ